MPKQNPKEQLISLPYKELKNLEKIWLKKIKAKSGYRYEYEKKELVKSIIGDLKKIANKDLADFK